VALLSEATATNAPAMPAARLPVTSVTCADAVPCAAPTHVHRIAIQAAGECRIWRMV
jgi:hypothetical protein